MKKLFFVAFTTLAFIHIMPEQQARAGEIVSDVAIEVEGMTCRSCEGHIRRTLSALNGVTSVSASHKTKRVIVSFDKERISLDAIKNTISGLGYKVN